MLKCEHQYETSGFLGTVFFLFLSRLYCIALYDDPVCCIKYDTNYKIHIETFFIFCVNVQKTNFIIYF